MRLLGVMVSIGLFALEPGVLFAQGFPSKPIRVLTSEPGGGNDFAARLIAQGLTATLGQPVIVDNRGAGGGVIAAEAVAKAAPDGYTLLFYGSNIWLMPFLRSGVPYDPVKDFAPITLAVRAPNILVVHPSLPVRSVRDVISLAKARPGQLNYGSGATGSSSQMATELFKRMARIDIVGMFAPAATPRETVMRLNQEIGRVLQRPEIKDKFFSVGVETVGSSPEEFGATVKSEMTRLGAVIREAGIRVD